MWVQLFSFETFTEDIFTLASLRVSATRYVGTVHVRLAVSARFTAKARLLPRILHGLLDGGSNN